MKQHDLPLKMPKPRRMRTFGISKREILDFFGVYELERMRTIFAEKLMVVILVVTIFNNVV